MKQLADGFGKGTPHHGPLADRTVRQFAAALASRQPTPGGGSAAALSGALGAALYTMVCRIALNRQSQQGGLRTKLSRVGASCNLEMRRFIQLVEDDAQAYQQLVDFLTQPDSPRRRAAQRRALSVPLAICERSVAVLRHLTFLESVAGRSLTSDVAAGTALLTGGFAAAAATVTANLDGLGQPARAAAIRRKLRGLTPWEQQRSSKGNPGFPFGSLPSVVNCRWMQ